MIEVPLTNSQKKAIIDDCFREEVLCQKWTLLPIGYARTTNDGGFGNFYLHQLIMGVKPSYHIDHINGDRLDNRMANLRHVTRSQQMWNRTKPRNNTSGHVGVSLDRGKWIARIKLHRKIHCLGTFSTIEEAVAARKKAEEEFYGKYSRRPAE